MAGEGVSVVGNIVEWRARGVADGGVCRGLGVMSAEWGEGTCVAVVAGCRGRVESR